MSNEPYRNFHLSLIWWAVGWHSPDGWFFHRHDKGCWALALSVEWWTP